MKRVILLVCCVMMVFSIAQARDFQVSANAGVINLGLSDVWATGLTMGLALCTPVKGNFSGEAELFYYFNPDKDLALENSEISSYGLNLNISGLYHFKLSKTKLKPYAAFGIGIFRLHSEWSWAGFGDTISETWLDIIFGGGATWSLNKKAGLKIDIRYIIIPKANGDFLRLTAGYYRSL